VFDTYPPEAAAHAAARDGRLVRVWQDAVRPATCSAAVARRYPPADPLGAVEEIVRTLVNGIRKAQAHPTGPTDVFHSDAIQAATKETEYEEGEGVGAGAAAAAAAAAASVGVVLPSSPAAAVPRLPARSVALSAYWGLLQQFLDASLKLLAAEAEADAAAAAGSGQHGQQHGQQHGHYHRAAHAHLDAAAALTKRVFAMAGASKRDDPERGSVGGGVGGSLLLPSSRSLQTQSEEDLVEANCTCVL
jgi:hypothetical protein